MRVDEPGLADKIVAALRALDAEAEEIPVRNENAPSPAICN